MKNKQIAIILIISLLMQMLINIIIPIKSIAAGDDIIVDCNDSKFYNALINRLGTKAKARDAENKRFTITKTDAGSVNALSMTNLGIEDITGIEKFTNITKLDLSNNKIEDIEPLRRLTKLNTLSLDNNQVSNISPISEIESLKSFSIKNGRIFAYVQKGSGENREINLPQIIQDTKIASSKVYTGNSLIFNNCKSSDNKIIVNANSGTDATVSVKGGNADGTIFRVKLIDENPPKLTATKSESGPTKQDVTVTITSDKELQDDEDGDGWKSQGWTLSEGKTILKKVFKENIAEPEHVEVLDFIGNEGSIDISVENIDRDPPQLTVSKNPDSATNENVTVTITANEEIQDNVTGWIRGGNKRTLTKTYTQNGGETVTVTDIAGNTAQTKINVDNIDKESPAVTVKYSEEKPTNQNVTVTITSAEEIQNNVSGWTKKTDNKTLTKTYTQNTAGEEKVTIIDKAGNKTVAIVSVQNIDKEKPTVTKVVYDPKELTNQNVTVTLTLSEEVQIPDGWIKGKEPNTIYKEYDANVGNEEVVIKDLAGNQVIQRIKIDNIDKDLPILEVEYSEKGPTNQNVTVRIKSSEKLQNNVEGWTISSGQTILTKVFEENTTKPEVVTVTDLSGNTAQVEVTVNNIDKQAPKLTVSYDPEAPSTNQNVKVTITSDEQIKTEASGWEVGGDKNTLTKTYNKNESETVTVADLAGNTAQAEVKVDYIDKEGPVLTINYSEEKPTNQNVTVTITSEEDIKTEVAEWTAGKDKKTLTKTYTQNASETVTVKDNANNESIATILVQNIDKEDPEVISINYSEENLTNQNVTVTLTLSEEVQIPDGWLKGKEANTIYKEYDANVANEKVVIVDLAGNDITETITVKNIDKVLPVLNVGYSEEEPTNQNVTVTITSDKELRNDGLSEEWYLSGNKKILTKEFERNTLEPEIVTVTDLAGNQAVATVFVQNIDKEAPEVVDIKYSEEEPTNQSVIVTLTLSEEIQIPDGWIKGEEPNTIYKEYDENVQEEEVIIKDLAGNEVRQKITIQNIDKILPEIEVEYSEENPTNQNVTVTIISNKELRGEGLSKDWILSDDKKRLTKEFEENTTKPEIVTVTDLAGNEVDVQVSVQNIDKDPPKIETRYDKVDKKIRVTLTSDEELQAVNGWQLDETKKILYKEYDVNKEETIIVKDLAGNETEVKISVTEIQQNNNGSNNNGSNNNGSNNGSNNNGSNNNGSNNNGSNNNGSNNNGSNNGSNNNGSNNSGSNNGSNNSGSNNSGSNNGSNNNGSNNSGSNNGSNNSGSNNNGSNNGSNNSGSNNNGSNNDNENPSYSQTGKSDNSRAPGDLPKTGKNILLIIGIISIIGIITFIKYRKYKDI